MNHRLPLILFGLFFILTKPVCWGQASVQITAGVGISTRPEKMFGAPFFISGALSVPFKTQWRIIAEAGSVQFRNAEYSDEKFGFWTQSYARVQHNYAGLRLGCNLLNTGGPDQLIVSGGADYMAVVEPMFTQKSGGLFSGTQLGYELKQFFNMPVQIDYKPNIPDTGSIRLLLSARYNINPYHSFPTVSGGIFIPISKHSKTL